MEESWPSGVCLQGLASNRLLVALAKDRCRERRRRSRTHVVRQVWIGKASTSEPSLRRRYVYPDIKTEGHIYLRDKPIGEPVYWVGGVRRKGGASPIWAHLWNCGNPSNDVKGESQVKKSKAQSTNALFGDGSVCSSDEVSVMDAEQRGRVIPVDARVNFLMEG